jgi:hypothetical protein
MKTSIRILLRTGAFAMLMVGVFSALDSRSGPGEKTAAILMCAFLAAYKWDLAEYLRD